MPVKLHGQHTFEAPREVVWRALVTPEILMRALPGCERLVAIGEHQYEGQLALKVGPVEGHFAGTVTLSDLVERTGYSLTLKGQGAPGFVEGKGSIRLSDAPGGTLLDYQVDTQVGGRIAGVGQRLLDSSSRVITRQALENLAAQIRELAAASAPGSTTDGVPAATPLPAPSQAEFAAKVATGVARDLAATLPWGKIALAGLVGIALLILLLRACSAP